MSVKVFKYGALPPSKDGKIREQMKFGRDYYNFLVERENERRQGIWGGKEPPKPPHNHENGDGKKCEECKNFWKLMTDFYMKSGFLDIKPYRAEFIEKGLYWGTYLIHEEAFSAAVKKTVWHKLLKFRSYREGGACGVQIISTNNNPENMYKISVVEDHRTGRRKGQRHQIQLRVGSDEKRKPIWSEPIYFERHRPIQGRVVLVRVCMKYVGLKEVWSVNITCKDVPDRTDNSNKGIVAVDVGWRVLKDDSVRIAFAMDKKGNETEFSMKKEWRELSKRADRIRSYRDNMLNELKEKNKKFKLIKNPSSVYKFAKKNGLLNDEILEWCKREKHLYDYEIGCRRHSTASRVNDMRVWIRSLRRKYKTVVIKNSSHKEMKDRKKAIESGMLQAQRRNAHHCSPGEVIEELCKVFGRKENVKIVPAEYTTATCNSCKHVNEFGPEQFVTCESCGATEDRDRVSTRNILGLYSAKKCEKPTARKTTAKFSKRHKKNDKE